MNPWCFFSEEFLEIQLLPTLYMFYFMTFIPLFSPIFFVFHLHFISTLIVPSTLDLPHDAMLNEGLAWDPRLNMSRILVVTVTGWGVRSNIYVIAEYGPHQHMAGSGNSHFGHGHEYDSCTGLNRDVILRNPCLMMLD